MVTDGLSDITRSQKMDTERPLDIAEAIDGRPDGL
jgi:hypothetical protein